MVDDRSGARRAPAIGAAGRGSRVRPHQFGGLINEVSAPRAGTQVNVDFGDGNILSHAGIAPYCVGIVGPSVAALLNASDSP